ncbi:MAG TPA: VOC family protein [Gemmatimonadaceae bacterium]|nr:VOC family protein [Gemmatimonadaceae bacterium]
MARKSARKKSTKKGATTTKRVKPRRAAAKRTTRSLSGQLRHRPTPGLQGWITHTELQSADPLATKSWCAKVLGWTFTQTMPMPEGGEYHLFAYSDQGGGGVRGLMPDESPGSSFTVHVADAHEAYARALTEGAEPVTPPFRVMEGVTIAVVRAPGGVRVGFSGP